MALIQFHFKEEPDTEERFAQLWNRLSFVLEFRGEIGVQEINIG